MQEVKGKKAGAKRTEHRILDVVGKYATQARRTLQGGAINWATGNMSRKKYHCILYSVIMLSAGRF